MENTSNYNLQNIIFDKFQISSINSIISSNNSDENKFHNILNYLYDNNLVYIFDWENWVEGKELITNFSKYDFKKKDMITILMLLTMISRIDRFNEGFIVLNCNNGFITELLKVMKYYLDNISKSDYFNSADIEFAIRNSKMGLLKYNEIMQYFQKTDVANDRDFQRKFNHFYKLRQRSPDFYKIYYNFLELNKCNKDITFEDILKYFQTQLGRFEPSFSSKILATINSDYPIWDSFVIQNLGFKSPITSSKNRFNETIYLYEKIKYWYQLAFKSEKCNEIIQLFDLFIPDTNISKTKKLDFVLWQLRK